MHSLHVLPMWLTPLRFQLSHFRQLTTCHLHSAVLSPSVTVCGYYSYSPEDQQHRGELAASEAKKCCETSSYPISLWVFQINEVVSQSDIRCEDLCYSCDQESCLFCVRILDKSGSYKLFYSYTKFYFSFFVLRISPQFRACLYFPLPLGY